MRKGFTLVELSIVLIIIGLIIGGVMKGRDLINSAEQKKIYNIWVKGWQIAVNTYQDKTGAILGDAPINGGTVAPENGQMDNIRLDNTVTVQNRLEAVGLDVPIGNIAATRGGSYNIKGKYTTQQVRVELRWRNGIGGFRNRLFFVNMPTDVAIAFDRMIDETMDASLGDFRIDGAAPAAAWPNASTTATVNVTFEI